RSSVHGEAEVLAVDLGGRAEAGGLVAHAAGAASVEVDLQGDGHGRAAHGQIAHELPGVAAQWLHGGRCEGDRRVVLHVEEVCALEVGITVVVSRAQADHADLHFDVRLLRLLGDRDPAAHVAEPAADLGDHEMAADELHEGVAAIDLVDTGHRDHPVVARPQHAYRSTRHRNSSPQTVW